MVRAKRHSTTPPHSAGKRTYSTLTTMLLLMALPATAKSGDGYFYEFLPYWLNILLSFATIIAVPVVVVVLLVGMWRKVFSTLWYIFSLQPLRRFLLRRHLQKQATYFRDLPARGDLKIANVVMNSLSSAWISDYQGLFGALILRLINRGALLIENKANMYGAEPHPLLTIGPRPTARVSGAQSLPLTHTEQLFYNMLAGAAGSDRTLQPRELQRYLRKNDKEPFFTHLSNLTPSEQATAQDSETIRQILGLQKFLTDFTVIGIRSIQELPLWQEYLVYATLFGMAEQVSRNFGQLYSDYFSANALALTQLNVVGNQALITYANAIAVQSKL